MNTKAFLVLGGLLLVGVLAIGGSNPDLMRPAGIAGLAALVLLAVVGGKGKSDAKGGRASGKKVSARR